MKGILKSEALAWITATGAAITVVANLDGVLKLLKFLEVLIRYWRHWTRSAWDWVFSLLPWQVTIPDWCKDALTMLLFWTALIVSSKVNVVPENNRIVQLLNSFDGFSERIKAFVPAKLHSLYDTVFSMIYLFPFFVIFMILIMPVVTEIIRVAEPQFGYSNSVIGLASATGLFFAVTMRSFPKLLAPGDDQSALLTSVVRMYRVFLIGLLIIGASFLVKLAADFKAYLDSL